MLLQRGRMSSSRGERKKEEDEGNSIDTTLKSDTKYLNLRRGGETLTPSRRPLRVSSVGLRSRGEADPNTSGEEETLRDGMKKSHGTIPGVDTFTIHLLGARRGLCLHEHTLPERHRWRGGTSQAGRTSVADSIATDVFKCAQKPEIKH